MPSIEIICVGQEHPSDFRDMPFAILAERRLDSHREPSLFGPKRAKSFGPITTEQFWKLHDTFKLRLNSLYDVVEKLSASPR